MPDDGRALDRLLLRLDDHEFRVRLPRLRALLVVPAAAPPAARLVPGRLLHEHLVVDHPEVGHQVEEAEQAEDNVDDGDHRVVQVVEVRVALLGVGVGAVGGDAAEQVPDNGEGGQTVQVDVLQGVHRRAVDAGGEDDGAGEDAERHNQQRDEAGAYSSRNAFFIALCNSEAGCLTDGEDVHRRVLAPEREPENEQEDAEDGGDHSSSPDQGLGNSLRIIRALRGVLHVDFFLPSHSERAQRS